MGYYVEDQSEKTLRLAKIKAYGKCDKYRNHTNWDDWLCGFALAGMIGFISCLYQAAYNDSHPKIETQVQMQTIQQPVKGINWHCVGKNGTPQDGIAVGVLTLPEAAVKTTKECTFTVAY